MATVPQLSNEEQVRLQWSQSAETMATTLFWKLLIQAMRVHERNALAELDKYLEAEAHPDREEVITLSLKWHARLTYLRLLLENVEDARNFKAKLRDAVMQQLMESPTLPQEEEVEQPF